MRILLVIAVVAMSVPQVARAQPSGAAAELRVIASDLAPWASRGVAWLASQENDPSAIRERAAAAARCLELVSWLSTGQRDPVRRRELAATRQRCVVAGKALAVADELLTIWDATRYARNGPDTAHDVTGHWASLAGADCAEAASEVRRALGDRFVIQTPMGPLALRDVPQRICAAARRYGAVRQRARAAFERSFGRILTGDRLAEFEAADLAESVGILSMRQVIGGDCRMLSTARDFDDAATWYVPFYRSPESSNQSGDRFRRYDFDGDQLLAWSIVDAMPSGKVPVGCPEPPDDDSPARRAIQLLKP